MQTAESLVKCTLYCASSPPARSGTDEMKPSIMEKAHTDGQRKVQVVLQSSRTGLDQELSQNFIPEYPIFGFEIDEEISN